MTTTLMVTGQRAKKLTMMATVRQGNKNDNNDGNNHNDDYDDSTMGNGVTGYDEDDDGNRQQQ